MYYMQLIQSFIFAVRSQGRTQRLEMFNQEAAFHS
jgi:hypothetical protein